eukprot:CAMPEP_0176127340 /NCGR_PEP_ID=MMETSP0120_2-20121206/64308_1 /TAXON_ID=160619 /ORGANISM="Kryptoperidinium foliaceum, Strain CCMP 1326" /LENGTH=109 /DNA_ID=CAMNT_0017462349 /DNA_START=15 /DNA_END=341 /DNA_ORIENTATION=-
MTDQLRSPIRPTSSGGEDSDIREFVKVDGDPHLPLARSRIQDRDLVVSADRNSVPLWKYPGAMDLTHELKGPTLPHIAAAVNIPNPHTAVLAPFQDPVTCRGDVDVLDG